VPNPITLDLALSRPSAVQPSPHVLEVAAMFGLGIDADRDIPIIPPINLTLAGGQLVFITGPSGSGKSSLLHLITQMVATRSDVRLIDMATTMPSTGGPSSDRPLVDCFDDLPLDRVLALLSLAGLNDAFVMLRKPSELSDGQRYRLRLARAMNLAGPDTPDAPDHSITLVLADEFGATLDRLTAAVIARNIRKWTKRNRHVCFVAATTHDDLLESLEPDVLIEKHLGSGIDVLSR